MKISGYLRKHTIISVYCPCQQLPLPNGNSFVKRISSCNPSFRKPYSEELLPATFKKITVKKIYPIIRTTIAGGFLFLLPLVVLILIFRKASGLLQTLLHPLLKPIENITFIGVGLYNLIAV